MAIIHNCDAWVPLGRSLLEHFEGGTKAELQILSSIEPDRSVHPSVFFRQRNSLPFIERLALKSCDGHILEIGAGAGTHALMLQNEGFEVTPIDISEEAVEVMKKRDLKNAVAADVFTFSGNKYDTILMLMNGIGIGGDEQGIAALLSHFRTLLNTDGQVIFDSTDIKYVTPDVRIFASLDSPGDEYYGVVRYQLTYRDLKGHPYKWIFIDKKRMERIAESAGYEMEILGRSAEHYLARLTIE